MKTIQVGKVKMQDMPQYIIGLKADSMIYTGDCLEELKKIPDSSVDAIVTDPPYELGFMGKSWDSTGIANNVDMWKECLRVLKPGGHLLSFGGTRTYHRMASAIEDAGFEIRDMIEWVYGSGFPKSLNIAKKLEGVTGKQSKGFNTAGGKENFEKQDKSFRSDYGYVWKPESELAKQWEGWGTALKPAHEPIVMARKPLIGTVAENVIAYGTGGINIDGCRVGVDDNEKEHFEKEWDREQSMSAELGGVAMNKGLKAVSLRDNVPSGRFPANLIHDGSDEVRECFPETKSGGGLTKRKNEDAMFDFGQGYEREEISDSGNASRFFKSIIYTAKASKSERNRGCEGLEEKAKVFNGQSNIPSKDMKDVEKRFTTLPKANNHPTVKPIALMEYLINMVTKEGQIVLDPFTGSGTTLIAAKKLGRKYIGIELEPEYVKIAEARLNAVQERLIL